MRGLIIVVLFAVIALSACGRGGNDENEREQTAQNGGGAAIGSLQSGEDALTLTISAPMGGGMAQISEAADRLQQELAQQGIDLHVEIIAYMAEERDEHFTTMLGQFAAGAGPDIFVRDNFLLYPFIENGFLMDIYTLIDASPNLSRGDFFTNALESFEIGGRLYTLPMQLGFDMVGINANVPAEFLNRFAALDRVSPSDFIGLYLDLIEAHPEWADFALFNGLQATQAFTPELTHALDFSNRTVNFPANAADLLENIRVAFEGNNRFGTDFFFNTTDETMAELQERYVFFRPAGTFGTAEAFFDFQQPSFQNFVPLADERGYLVDRSFGLHICVNADANEVLVLAFIEHLLSATGLTGMNFQGQPHITTRYARDYLTTGVRTALTQFQVRPTFDSESTNIDRAVDRIMAYAELPTNFLPPNWILPSETFFATLTNFLNGDSAAADAIAQMEEDITAWFNEERAEIEAYVPEEEIEIDLPVQVLTIQANDRHTGVFQQAAAAMNAAWQERGKPYIFQVEINDYTWNDFENWQARLDRLQIELMAGQGPDIFLIDTLDIRRFANSGFLVDINTLIENSPFISRDDFFTQALDAVEINGGLYAFPISFGFYYVGINAGLPRSFRDRFAAEPTITIAQIMDIYLDLMAAHGDEFGHLIPGVSWSIGDFVNLINAAMSEFIDFESRTSNLTDPAFIAFLNRLPQIFDGRESIASGWSAMPAGGEDFMRDRAREQVFEMNASNLTPMNAFFSRRIPHFVHYAPLVDNYGRLLLNNRSFNTWANFAITAAGNPDLAWEFVIHLLDAYTYPRGRAVVEPVWGTNNPWANHSIASPIRRSHFESNTRQALDWILGWGVSHLNFTDTFTHAGRNPQIDATISRIGELNEHPMVMLDPLVPMHIFGDTIEHFQLGIITAQAAAQQMHNAVSLWLMEMGA